jgi:hypothetical protein
MRAATGGAWGGISGRRPSLATASATSTGERRGKGIEYVTISQHTTAKE